METSRQFPRAKEAWPRDLNDSLRLQSHLALVMRAQMTKGLYTLPKADRDTQSTAFLYEFPISYCSPVDKPTKTCEQSCDHKKLGLEELP